MGNKVQRQRTTSKIFSSSRESKASVSVTIPSVCTSPSFHLSLKKSTSTTSSEKFNWNQMKNLYMRQEYLTVNHLTPTILKVTTGVFEILKRQMGELIGDLNAGVLKLPEGMGDRWGVGMSSKSSQALQQSTINLQTSQATRKMIVHFVKMLYVHDLILTFFANGQFDEALELLKQVAVSHALLGISCTEFRMMDWFIVHYLIKNKITSDENISSLLAYLNTLSNYITFFYESQSVRTNMTQNLLLDEKKNHRHNKARENFRLMKKWKKEVETFQEQEYIADALLTEQMQFRKTEDDMQSVDTLTLKENDFIMKHFLKKKGGTQEGLDLNYKSEEHLSKGNFESTHGGNYSTRIDTRSTKTASGSEMKSTKSIIRSFQ